MPAHPARIGKYRIISQIGRGGMGAVYKAEHPTLKKSVIIKKLTLTDSKDFIERFRREAQLMMEFRNEKIVQVYDHFKEGDGYHIVMEYVDGTTLENLIESKRFLSEEAALLIFSEICQALKYAHDNQIIHRDIKPANILISNNGEVKLVDFGVSASLDSSDEEGLTKAGMTIGTPSYLAPEQIANARNRDKRSDIYSMGVLLYEMVLGKKPFRGGFSPDVLALIEKGKYTLPRKINPKISSNVQSIIRKTMHHKVQKRFQDLGVVIKKISKFNRHFRNQDQVKEAIKAYLEGNDSLIKRRPGRFRTLLKTKTVTVFGMVFLFLAILAVLGALGYQRGLHNEWLYGDDVGALQVIAKIGKKHKQADEVFIKSLIFKEKNNSLDLDESATLHFREIKHLENNDYYTLASQKIYLQEGLYKIVLYAENEQYRENFYLPPRKLQKHNLDSYEAQKVTFTLNKNQPSLPVDAIFKVFDITTNRDITRKASADVRLNGEWINWNDIKQDNDIGFWSGKRYRIRFKHPDFITKYYNLTIQPEQTRVTVKINLVPVPGTIQINSDIEKAKITINSSDYYLDGGQNRELKQLPELSHKTLKLTLSPGEYEVDIQSGSLFSSSSAKQTIILNSRDLFIFSVTEQDGELQLNLQ